ncbi:MAG: T9SS type A sorting domain-containing protein [Candidatus Marinimicrobia bacterium]|nr:T9SS type A sorting domain-containing protein [Candidatus Neomarinimicrobiota bacterium]
MKRFFLIVLFSSVIAQDTLKVMNYNALRFTGNTMTRAKYIKKIVDYIQPDLVILEEIEHQDGLDLLLNTAFNGDSTVFAAGNLPSSQWMKNGIIYRKSKLDISSDVFISTVLRDIPGYTLSIKNAHSNVGPFTVFGTHLKASDGTSEANQRWEEAKELYKYVAQKDNNYHYITAGDFNVYGTDEPAYKLLTDSMTVDLEDPVGSWVRNEGSHVEKYTQSTRTENLGDGGSTGGLDDRFDFILFSDHFTAKDPDLKFLEGSYKVIGNDGNHFNKSIVDGSNSAVPDSIAEAIYRASDHYPVVAKIVYTSKSATSPVAHAGGDVLAKINDKVYLDASQSYDPNGSIVSYAWLQTSGPATALNNSGTANADFVVPEVNRTTVFTFKLTVTDNDGEWADDFVNITVPVVGGYTPYDIQLTANKGTGEDCFPSEFEGQNLEVTGVVTAVRPDAEYPNFFFQDPFQEEWAGMFVYIHEGYKAPSVGDQVMLKGDISEYYGMTEMKNITSTEVLSSGIKVEPVIVTASSVSGECRVWVEKYEGMLVRLVNVEVTQSANQDDQWIVSDWSGSATLDNYMFDGDWPRPDYGTHFISITGVLHYSYGEYKLMPRNSKDFNDPVTATGDELPERFELLTNYPNPFNPTTTIEFDVVNNEKTHGHMSLQILDINGRVVANLINGIPSSNKVVWHGENGFGRDMPAGVYFARLESGTTVLTQKMILLK